MNCLHFLSEFGGQYVILYMMIITAEIISKSWGRKIFHAQKYEHMSTLFNTAYIAIHKVNERERQKSVFHSIHWHNGDYLAMGKEVP